MTKFADLLVAQLPKFDNKRIRLAEAIGLTPSRLTRAIKGEYALDVPNCLRLALAANLDPSEVLRTAGKSETAELIEKAYGKNRDGLTARDREHLDRWHRISDRARANIETVIGDLLPYEAPATAERPDRKKKSA